MSIDEQIAVLARKLAETKATLAAKVEGADLEQAIGNPFRFVADQIGDVAATSLFIRFDIRSLGEALRSLAVAQSYKTSPPPLEPLLDDLDGQRSPGWRSQYRNQREITEHAIALARQRAQIGASRTGPDLVGVIGEPFTFLRNQIGERAAVAFFLTFDARSIDVTLRAIGWMLAYQELPPSIDTLLTEMAGKEAADFEAEDICTKTIH